MEDAIYTYYKGVSLYKCPNRDNLNYQEEIMCQDSVERLLGRLLTDTSFRIDAAASLANVCRREGYDLTEGELSLVERINISTFETVASQLDPGLCRAATPSKKSPHAIAGKG